MAIQLEEYQEFLEKIAPEVREVLEASYQEASRLQQRRYITSLSILG